MSNCKLKLIGAACANMGIGVNGNLPWRLKNEMAYFSSMTRNVTDPSKVNAVVMGRISWDCIPLKYRPLAGRVNIVLTRNADQLRSKVPEGVIVVSGLDEAISYVQSRPDIESTWVIGGAMIYKTAMEHPNCDRIYLTEIMKEYDCDTFFPAIDKDKFKMVEEDGVSKELQTEGDVTYYYRVFKRINTVK